MDFDREDEHEEDDGEVDLSRDPQIHKIMQLLRQINSQLKGITVSLDSLTAAVAANTSASDSVIVLIQGIVTQLTAAIASGADPVALQALVDQLTTNTAELAKAVTDNTPVPPPVV